MILSGFSPPKFGQLPTKNEGGVEGGEEGLLIVSEKMSQSRHISGKKS
jgi:hypothetical protein